MPAFVQTVRFAGFLWLMLGYLAIPAYAELYISEITRLDFATLEIPQHGAKRSLTVEPDGGYHGSGEVISGTPQRGEYYITDPFSRRNQTISINIQNIDGDSPFITLGKFRGIYNNRRLNFFPAWNLQNPGIQGKSLYLGATVEYTNRIQEGIYHPSYDIVIIYE